VGAYKIRHTFHCASPCIPQWLDATERDCTGHRASSCTNSPAVIAAVHDPLTIGRASGNNAYVVAPHNDHSNAWSSCRISLASPLTREGETSIGFAEVAAQIGAAPGRPAVSMVMMAIVLLMMRMMRTSMRRIRCGEKHSRHN
jgi:hypothetical protein